MTTFSDLGLSAGVLKALEAGSITEPTPVQARAIPAIMNGEDVLAIAQTGTGKTAAFVLPLLTGLQEIEEPVRKRRVQVLILVPTRELASQVHTAVQTFGRFDNFTTTLVQGGVKPERQIKALTKGVDICVATPGRLLDHIRGGVVKLDETRFVVFDEADQMLDMGFIPAIREIAKMLPEERQAMMLSATMAKPIKKLAMELLNKPNEISVSPPSTPVERITQELVRAEPTQKRKLLLGLLSDPELPRTMLFTRTKRSADRLYAQFRDAGLDTAVIHGDRSQGQRERALGEFRKGAAKVLIATDVAARGLDIPDVELVINYELPMTPESYVHRIGRTARAGKSGRALSLCSGKEGNYLKAIVDLIKVRPFELPLTDFDLSAQDVTPERERNRPEGRSGGGRPGGGRSEGRSDRGRGDDRRSDRKGPGGPRRDGPGGQGGGRRTDSFRGRSDDRDDRSGERRGPPRHRADDRGDRQDRGPRTEFRDGYPEGDFGRSRRRREDDRRDGPSGDSRQRDDRGADRGRSSGGPNRGARSDWHPDGKPSGGGGFARRDDRSDDRRRDDRGGDRRGSGDRREGGYSRDNRSDSHRDGPGGRPSGPGRGPSRSGPGGRGKPGQKAGPRGGPRSGPKSRG